MQNLLILYNPYYQSDVIAVHLEILRKNGRVAFGKVRSKLRDLNANSSLNLSTNLNANLNANSNTNLNSKPNSSSNSDFTQRFDIKSVSKNAPLQLFLTDYANLFVAKVVEISIDPHFDDAPSYYKDKNLDVECWFIIEDLRELVRDDFVALRDEFLANFTTPDFGSHTYAIYGNSYEYPLKVALKHEISYFEGENHAHEVFKSEEFLHIKNQLKLYCFGDFTYKLHPDSLDDIIAAECEFLANHADKMYDFSAIIVRYAKAYEREIWACFRAVFTRLLQDESLANIEYSVQQKPFKLPDILHFKPNLGTYVFLLKNERIKSAINSHFKDKFFLLQTLPRFINGTLQDIRNATIHAKKPSLKDAQSLRNSILGVGENSIMLGILAAKLAV